MGTLFTLGDDIRGVAQQALDDLLGELSRPCRLLYPPQQQSCGNPACWADAVAPFGSGSAAWGEAPVAQQPTWVTGRPEPARVGGGCACGGSGFIWVDPTEDLRLQIKKRPPHGWGKANVQVPTADARVKCLVTDMNKLRQCRQLVVNPDSPFEERYELTGLPADVSNIVQNRYFTSYLVRVK